MGGSGSGASLSAIASCQAGEHATGGGFQTLGFDLTNIGEAMAIDYNGPNPSSGSPTGWRVAIQGNTTIPFILAVYVICGP